MRPSPKRPILVQAYKVITVAAEPDRYMAVNPGPYGAVQVPDNEVAGVRVLLGVTYVIGYPLDQIGPVAEKVNRPGDEERRYAPNVADIEVGLVNALTAVIAVKVAIATMPVSNELGQRLH